MLKFVALFLLGWYWHFVVLILWGLVLELVFILLHIRKQSSSCMQPYTLQHFCSKFDSNSTLQLRRSAVQKNVDPWLVDWIHSECVAWFVLQEFSVYSMVLLSPGHIVSIILFCWLYLEESVAHYFYLYTQWYFSHTQSCIHNLYTNLVGWSYIKLYCAANQTCVSMYTGWEALEELWPR